VPERSNQEVAIDQKRQTRVWNPARSSRSLKCSLPTKSIERSLSLSPSSTSKLIATEASLSGSMP
jgi:hypothetical protein